MYSCHNKDAKAETKHTAQDGWNDDGTRKMVEVVSTWLEDTGGSRCGHIGSAEDSRCIGCEHRRVSN
jgi:hypothetical protein